ncbi:hypothetical protein V1512DRAFT_83015 [Lipomyces arxii]|uniref:uncharacterized protein n=1 Tax=Lipomyces arxii TaxID=56418 RepID=UPI0034CDA9B0
MVPRKFKKTGKRLPRGQKPMVNAAPASDLTASNALSAHVRPFPADRGVKRKMRNVKTHGPLGNVRVDKRALGQKRTAARMQADALKRKQQGKPAKKPAKEPELQLNTALKPAGIIHRRGKKGKVFADDADTLSKVLSVVTARMDEAFATKIERAKQLEEVREAKRNEIEKREAEKVSKLESKKREIKRSKRKLGKSAAVDRDEIEHVKPKRSVRFNV